MMKVLISILAFLSANASVDKTKAASELQTLKDELFVEEITPQARKRLREETAKNEKLEFDDLEATYFTNGGEVKAENAVQN